MDFSGWERLSLLDYDDRIATTFFMAGCNFRCPFCHNSSLVLNPKDAPTIPWEEMRAYLIKRQGVIDAVCITGGEPTLMPDLKEKIQEIKSLGYLVKLDTNGTNPKLLRELIEEGLLDYVAMDIKNSKDKYPLTAGTSVFLPAVEESVRILLEGKVDYEFRTTMIEEFHEESDFLAIREWIKGAKRYFLQKYIDSENCIAHGFHEISKEKALNFKALLEESLPFVALRGYE